MPEHATPLGILPLVAFVLSGLACAALRERLGVGRDLREAAIVAAIGCGVWVAAGSELLSLPRWFAPAPVLVWWLAAIAALGIFCFQRRKELATRLPRDGGSPRRTRLLVSLCAGFALLPLLPAVLSAPNNWDALAYHLPRQIYWIEHRTVAHYAVSDLRQIMMAPLAEYFGAHLMLLSGGDAWANLVQWFALILTMIAASLVARDLGGRPPAQALAALLVVLNPIAFMQASSPKNDLLLSLWAVVLAWLVLRIWRGGSALTTPVLLAGASLGLLFLTKATAIAHALPFVLIGGCVLAARLRWRSLALGAAAGALAIAIAGGHYGRNARAFGSPSGPLRFEDGGFPLQNGNVSVGAVLSNIVRNAALHVRTPADRVNGWLTGRIERLHGYLGLSADDPRTTFPPGSKFDVRGYFVYEDTAPASVHFVLILLVPLVILARRGLREDPRLWTFLAAAYSAFLLLCVVFRWQMWNARFHLPVFCLFAPVAAIAVSSVRLAPLAVAAAGVGVLLPTAVWSHERPLRGPGNVFIADRVAQMFRHQPWLEAPTRETVDFVGSLRPRRIGLRVADELQLMYALQRLLLDRIDPRPALSEFNAEWLRGEDRFEFLPDVVVATNTFSAELWQRKTHELFAPIAEFPPFRIYIPEGLARARGANPSAFPFIGWEFAYGLAPLVPPSGGSGAGRWGLAPRTRLIFESSGRASELILEAESGAGPGQVLTVVCNGATVWRQPLGAEQSLGALRIPLAVRKGWNDVALEYGASMPLEGQQVALFFRKLQLLPSATM